LGDVGIATAGAGNDVTIEVTEGNVCTTDRRFHCDFDGHSWPDLMEPGWEPTETNVIYLGWEHMAKGVAKFGQAVQVAAAGTNLCTEPSFEAALVNWVGVNAGLNRVTDEYWNGDYSLETVATAANGYARGRFAVAALTDYAVHYWMKATTSSARLYVWEIGTGAEFGTRVYHSGSGEWEHLVITGTTGAAATHFDIRVQDMRAAGWDAIYVDAVQIEASAYPTPPIDGSLGAGHAWTGAAHASTSTRAAATLTCPNDVAAYPSGDCLEQLTIAGWFIPVWASDALPIGQSRMGFDIWGGAAASRIMLNYTQTGEWRVYIAGAYRLLSVGQTFNPWEPQFVVITLDFDADDYNLYVNDQAVVNDTTALAPPAFGANLFNIGASVSGGSPFDGLIDDFVIYPRVLSATEISAIYKFGNPLLPPTHANMRQIFGEWESAYFDGTARTTTAWTTIDLVDDCGIPFGAKAVSVMLEGRDNAGNNQYIRFRKDATLGYCCGLWNSVVNRTIMNNGIIPVANGRTIDYEIAAGGGASFEIRLRVVGVWL